MWRWCARHANLALVDVDEIREPGEMLRILCECGDRHCTEWLAIRAEDFADLRAEPEQYVVAQAHTGGLRVMRQTVDYAVVLQP